MVKQLVDIADKVELIIRYVVKVLNSNVRQSSDFL